MGTYPHGADRPPERSAADSEPHVPRPLPQRERHMARTATVVMFVAIAIVALVVLL
jgi:hypothetical protein